MHPHDPARRAPSQRSYRVLSAEHALQNIKTEEPQYAMSENGENEDNLIANLERRWGLDRWTVRRALVRVLAEQY